MNDKENYDDALHSGLWRGVEVFLAAISGPTILLRMAGGFRGRGPQSMQVKPENLAKLRSEIEMRSKDIDNGKHKGLDEQQANIGNIDIGT